MATAANIVLGISAFYHDSAAALLIDGKLVAAAQQERFSRTKHDADFPKDAIISILSQNGLRLADVDTVAFYDKPYIKFERLLETYHLHAPRGLNSFLKAIPVWIKEKLFLKKLIRDELNNIEKGSYRLLFPEHHLSHAASAFYPSPFTDAAILTIDGVGEWATTTIGTGKADTISTHREIHFPHSLGLLYSACTYYCGFKVNSGEYKLMGLAPYGNATAEQTLTFVDAIKTHLIHTREDGSFRLNLDYFDYPTGLTMTKDQAWLELFGLPRLAAETELSQPYMNLALAMQLVTEELVIKLAKTACTLSGSKNLVMAGGVALNCVANGKLQREPFLDNLWIQPAAGDAGGAVGAALAAWHIALGNERTVEQPDAMSGTYLGPEFSAADTKALTARYGAVGQTVDDEQELLTKTSELLNENNVVGWFQNRMEFGPRALCNRSILGDPGSASMQKKINLNIKYREGFRPFAPVVPLEDIKEYFDIETGSPYMLLVAPVKNSIRKPIPANYEDFDLYQRLYVERSELPAITHVDFSARIQSVTRDSNPRMHKLLNTFKKHSGYSVLVNTSFNVRGEPIVCTPEDAYRCFMQTDMDALVIENTVFLKADQPPWSGPVSNFELD